MKPSRSWADLLLVAFAVALTGWGVHGLLQRDTVRRADRPAAIAEEQRERPATPVAVAREARPVVRSEPQRTDVAIRYLPPSGFDPEFRDPADLDPDYADFLEELEIHEAAEDEMGELFATAEFEPELSDAVLAALDDDELARELETYDAYIAELANDRTAR